MAKTKCILCKLSNVRKECEVHPNAVTFLTFTKLSSALMAKAPEAIASVCEEHRNPMKFVTTFDALNKNVALLADCCKRGVPYSLVAAK